MKKLLILTALVLLAYRINAQNTCGTAIPLSACMTDSVPASSIKWYSFTASSNKERIQVIGLASSPAHINNISLYTSCSGLPIAQVNASGPTQDTLVLLDSTLTPLLTYYVALNNNPVGCLLCPIAKATYTICGLIGYEPFPNAGCITWSYNPNPSQNEIQKDGISGCCCPYSNNTLCGGEDDFTVAGCSAIVCSNEIVTFSEDDAYSGTPYLTITNPSNTVIDHDPTTPYQFQFPNNPGPNPITYTVTFTDITGTINLTNFPANFISVTVEPLPIPTFTLSSNTLCPGDAITLTKTDATPPYQDWYWYDNEEGGGIGPYIPIVMSGTPTFGPNPYTFTSCELLQIGTNQIGLIESNGGSPFNFDFDNDMNYISGCAVLNQTTVTLDNFQPTFTYTYPCNGNGLVSFTNTSTCPNPGSSNYTWIWDFGDGSPFSYLAQPIPHKYLPGTYTVYLYANTVDPNCGYLYTRTPQTFTIYPPINITITGNNLACLPGNAYCVTVAGGSGNYINGTWALTNGTFVRSATCNGINVNIPNTTNGGTVYYTVTDGATGCVYTDSLVVMGCCPLGEGDRVPPLENATLSSLHSPPFPSGPYIDAYNAGTWTFAGFNNPNHLTIDGVLTVDQDMIIRNSDVELGTNAQINITAGHSLVIESCYFHACADMWDGIYVQPGGFLSIGVNSLIEDAQSAVVSVDGGNYFIINTTFNKDYKGIVVQPYNGAHPGLVYKSTFACNHSAWPSLALGAPSTLIAPDLGIRTSEGVEINNVNSITIGRIGFTNGNTFQNLDYGVNSTASSVTVINNTFDDNIPAAPGIIGVYAKGDPFGTYTVNIGTTDPNTFNNWQTGVFVRDTLNANVENNNFTGNAQGIEAWNNLHNLLKLNNNTMNGITFIGINAYNNPTCGVYMLNNTINGSFLRRFAPTGIYINEVAITPSTHYYVNTNRISAVINGVYGSNLWNANIVDNDIILINGTPGFNEGIYAASSFSSLIQHNTISSLALGSNNEEGIYVNGGSGSNNVLCNSSTGNNNGIVFSGPSVTTNMVQNTMTLNTTGLLLHSSATIGNQGTIGNPNDNQWFFCTNATSAIFPPTFFVVRSPINSSYWPPLAKLSLNTIFTGTSGTSCYNCTTGSGCGGGGATTGTALAVVNESTSFISFPSTSHWLEKHSLYRYLESLDSSLLSNATIRHFRDSAATANMGKLETISALMADSNGVSPLEIANATSLNNALISPDTAEQTAQAVNAISITMQATGRNLPNAAQKTALQAIAPLCPALYGNAVFIARALLSQVDSNIYISLCEMEDDTTHGHHHVAIKPDETPVSAITAKVYPNPANTILNIDVQLQSGQVANMELYNSLGQRVQNEELKNTHTTLNIEMLSAGIYYYRILDNNGNLISADKVTIIH